MHNHSTAVIALMLVTGSHAAPAFADTPPKSSRAQSVVSTVETQEFSKNQGSLRSATLELKLKRGDTTVLLSPTVGERRTPGGNDQAVGIDGAIYQNWSSIFSTRTQFFVSENAPVFAQRDFAQDVTVAVGGNSTLTFGGRWALYFGGQDVTFLSVGARKYFRFGSVALRLTHTNPEGRRSFIAPIVNVSVKDSHGSGKTQLWLGTGAASISRSQLEDNFRGKDYAISVQRVQPVSKSVSLVPSLGYSSYDRTNGRVGGVALGMGLAWSLE